jgi:hypothetical protein
MQIHTQPAPKVMSYYGSKYILARHYPTPRHPLIIEPFAGGAAYSLHHPEREVHLYDLNEKVCGVWDYIIRATPQEIIALPLLGAEDTVDALPAHLPQEARWMIGWWIKYALSAPCKSFSTNGKSALARTSHRQHHGLSIGASQTQAMSPLQTRLLRGSWTPLTRVKQGAGTRTTRWTSPRSPSGAESARGRS